MNEKRPKIIRHGRLLDIRGHQAEPADILIEGDAIAAIGQAGMAAPKDAEVIDATDKLIHPGLVNAHTHGHGNLAKGMGDHWTLELLLTAGPWIGGYRRTEDKYLTTYIGAIEMLLKGCTACYDLTAEFPLPTSEGLFTCSQAYQDAGIRAVLAPMVASNSFFEAIPGLNEALPKPLQTEVERLRMAPAQETLDAIRAALHDWPGKHDLVRPAVAPTIPHHCSDEFMTGCAELAREYGVGLHSHIQESKIQVIVGRSTYGTTQTAHLQKLGLLGPDFVAAHGVWLDNEDIQRLTDAGASLAHNPGSNMRLGSGIATAKAMFDQGLNVGIGTDGASCSDNLNMYEAMRLASLASKVRSPDTNQWLGTEEIAMAATRGSAQALGLGDQIGEIAVGYKADMVLLDLNNINWIPINDPTNQLVHTEDGSAVHTVLVGGRAVVQDHRPVGVDMTALAFKAEQARERLAADNEQNRLLYERLAPIVNSYCPGLAAQPYHVDHYGSRTTGCSHQHH